MSLIGTFAGVVEDTHDPERLGRLKVRVPHVYGAVGGVFGAITTENIPWALPAGLPNGLSQQSGGMDWLPLKGDQVLVRFLDGEPEKPVWEWFMQTQAAAKTFKLHQYADAPGGLPGSGGGDPKRGAIVRYGHTVEWNADGLILTTSKGYRVLLTDASIAGNDGDITISTAAGQFLDLDDSVESVTFNANLDYQINVGNQMLALCDSISLQAVAHEIELITGSYLSIDAAANLEGTVGANWLMDVMGDTTHTLAGNYQIDLTGNWTVSADIVDISAAGTLTLASVEPMTLDFPILLLGAGSTEPFVLGNQLLAYLNTLAQLLTSHTHVDPQGGVTSPMTPPAPAPSPALLSATVKGH